MPTVSFIQAINSALAEELRHDPRTFLMGLDVWVGAFGATGGLTDEFGPGRIRNAPMVPKIRPAGRDGAVGRRSVAKFRSNPRCTLSSAD